MMGKFFDFRFILPFVIFLANSPNVFSQVDTTYLFNPNAAYGPLDIRISKGSGHSYYIQENKTFSFRENNGIRTNSYLKMTAWDSNPYSQGNLREKINGLDQFVMNFRLLAPQNYNASFPDGYPLVVVMHGYLERGNCAEGNCYHGDKEYSPNKNLPPAPKIADHELLNNDYNLVHGGLNFLEAHQVSGSRLPNDPALPAKAFPGFVVFPQNLNGWDQSSSQDVIRLIRLLSKKYNIDENRIYINGISHGGHGAYEVLKRVPWMFAAAIMFSAADDASVISQKITAEISRIPLWIFQGGLDEKPTQTKTESYIKAFRKAGANVRYTLYPQLGHGTWNKAFDEPDFFSWILAQNRMKLHAFAGNATVCKTSGSGTLLTLPQGFTSYQWEYQGVIINNQNSNSYAASQAGIYRGRFLTTEASSSQWSRWSDPIDLKEKNPPAAEIKQIGTLLLKDLNGNPNARLEASGNFPYYYWYKNGALLSLESNEEDTIQGVIMKSNLGNGAYSLKVADYDNCKSVESNVKKIIFNDEAPLSMAAAADFKAIAISPSEILLTWAETNSNESGFEIWRKKQDHNATFSPWEMAALTGQNAVSYTDKNLSPSSTYHYKIRAINASERSAYNPEGANTIIAITSADRELPSAPGNLSATQEGVNSIRLKWSPSVDNSSIREYVIFYNDDSIHTNARETTHLLKDLKVNTVYSFEVRAVDQGANLGPPSNQARANTFLSGLYFEHSTGAWENLKDIDWSIAEFTGMINNFTLLPKTQQDFFNFRFDGFLNITKDGIYQFRITSDDGSSLSLNDTLLIENDGIHNINTVTSPVQLLNAGPLRITVKYFDFVKTDTLLIEYKGPDSNKEWVKIPEHVLTSNIITATESNEDREFAFSVYPNPITDYSIKLHLQSKQQNPVSILIVDPAGRKVYEKVMDFKENIEITSSNLQSGMYIISLRQGSSILNKKIIVR